MERKIILFSIALFNLVFQNITAMEWIPWGSNPISPEVQRANRQLQDSHTKEKIKKDIRLELLLRLIEKNKDEIQALHQKYGSFDDLISNNNEDNDQCALLNERITIENAQFQEKLNDLDKSLLDQKAAIINAQKKIADFTKEHGAYAEEFSRHLNLPGEVAMLKNQLLEKDKAIKILHRTINGLSTKVDMQEKQLENYNHQLETINTNLSQLLTSFNKSNNILGNLSESNNSDDLSKSNNSRVEID